MIGIQYLKYHPTKLFSLPNGLTIFQSPFSGPDGSRAIVGGPHNIFSEVHKNLGNNHVNTGVYFTKLAQIYRNGYLVSFDTSLLYVKEEIPINENEIMFNDYKTNTENVINDLNTNKNEVYLAKRPPKNLKKFEEIESAGTEVSYRCVRCRGCEKCIRNKSIDCISIQEEVEQEMINKSVQVNLEENYTKALLPFLSDPVKKLAPNKHVAEKVYKGVTKILKNNPKDKADVIKAEKKLQDLGFVDFIENLTTEEQQVIFSSPILHFLPWRVVWNTNSLSTPCRPVFDASMPTSS